MYKVNSVNIKIFQNSRGEYPNNFAALLISDIIRTKSIKKRERSFILIEPMIIAVIQVRCKI